MIDYSIIGKRFGRLTVINLDHVGEKKTIALGGDVYVIAETRQLFIEEVLLLEILSRAAAIDMNIDQNMEGLTD